MAEMPQIFLKKKMSERSGKTYQKQNCITGHRVGLVLRKKRQSAARHVAFPGAPNSLRRGEGACSLVRPAQAWSWGLCGHQSTQLPTPLTT